MSISSNLPHFDAIIVLANEMDKSGFLNTESMTRAIKAVEFFKCFQSSKIVTCGWAYRYDSGINIADALKSYIINHLGINNSDVIAESNSRDTVGDAYYTKINLALLFNWKKVCVVTSDYHVKRTQEIFNFIYGSDISVQVYGTFAPYNEIKLYKEISSTIAFRDTFKGVQPGNNDDILYRLRTSHPYYNGDIYKRI